MPRSRPYPKRRQVGATVLSVVAAIMLLLAGPASSHAGAAGQESAPLPASLTGIVVDADTGERVSRILVSLRDVVTLEVLARDVTNVHGVYFMNGLTEDEYAVKFNGSARGYETGFLACFRAVVPHYGDACTFGTEVGFLGKARLEHL